MVKGDLRKMTVQHGEPIQYTMAFDTGVNMNELLGNEILLKHTGIIHCSSCGAVTKKSFGQGFCYKCFINAPESSECIIRPELCRAHLGEGRDVEWEQRNHNQPHVVYLALTDQVKVGVTRSQQVPVRWIDQGAYQAIRLAETPNRYEAGRIEVALKSFYTDKTNWRNMLKNVNDESVDLIEEKWRLEEMLPSDISSFISDDDEVMTFEYPVLQYPEKIKSVSFDKEEEIRGVLQGVKGQYLLLNDDRVLNIRKHTGYEIELFF
ncbi:DUF2797 domain-containing protein [Wandonia haliotis]|uniref:DUF2797 domain-containing protein n=1 Tax=Wandonia haliotis TaxID=574963 RepID=A0ABP3Y4X4_9FLAO